LRRHDASERIFGATEEMMAIPRLSEP